MSTDHNIDTERGELVITEFYGGEDRGKMIQVNSPDGTYTTLTVDEFTHLTAFGVKFIGNLFAELMRSAVGGKLGPDGKEHWESCTVFAPTLALRRRGCTCNFPSTGER